MAQLVIAIFSAVTIASVAAGESNWAGFWLLKDTVEERCLTTPAYKTWSVSKIEDCAGKCLQDYPSCRSAHFDGSTCEANAKHDPTKLTSCSGKKYLPMIFTTKDLSSVTLNTDPSGYTCEAGWSNYEDGCFLYQDATVAYDVASQMCRLYLGKTASLENIEQHYFVTKMIPDNVNKVYIGYLKDAYNDALHYWSDGSNATYTSWADAHALYDSRFKSLLCVRMSRELGWNWEMVDCDERIPFVCKKPGFK